MNRIEPSQGVAFVLKKNQILRVVDVEGQQVSDLFCVSLHDRQEVLSCARSMDYADKIFLTTGDYLYSNRSQPLLKIIEDTCGQHDLLMPPCSLKMFQIVAEDENYNHPSCHENLSRSLAPFDLRPDQIQNSFNIFMNVQVGSQGKVQIHPPVSRAGDQIIFQAQMDLIVALTACSHEETNAGRLKPISYAIEELSERKIQ